MKKLTFLLFALFVASNLSAQTKTFKTTKEAHAFADGMVKQIIGGQAKEAFEGIKPYWPLNEYTIDGLAQTTADQIPMLTETFGEITGYEFIGSETLGNSGHLETFLIKYQQSALRIYIVFYNGGEGWLVNSLSWDDKWDLLFKTKIHESK